MDNYYINELLGNGISKGDASKITKKPMSDSDITYYFPDAKIKNTSELAKYNTIEELFPNNKLDYLFLLYRQTPYFGHWCLLVRRGKRISYFDPYGIKYDKALNWVPLRKRITLGEMPYVTKLLNEAHSRGYTIDWNPFDFQSKKIKGMSTCGRHCCFRLKTIIDYDMDIGDYMKLMKYLKKKSGQTYDEIVADLINIVSHH
jgi:hypothetical protein